MFIGIHVKWPSVLSDFNEIESSRQIFEKFSKPDFMKIRPLRAEFFHADSPTDRRTDGQTKLIVVFRNLEKTPKKRVSELEYFK